MIIDRPFHNDSALPDVSPAAFCGLPDLTTSGRPPAWLRRPPDQRPARRTSADSKVWNINVNSN
jgi:hypothetical protein